MQFSPQYCKQRRTVEQCDSRFFACTPIQPLKSKTKAKNSKSCKDAYPCTSWSTSSSRLHCQLPRLQQCRDSELTWLKQTCRDSEITNGGVPMTESLLFLYRKCDSKQNENDRQDAVQGMKLESAQRLLIIMNDYRCVLYWEFCFALVFDLGVASDLFGKASTNVIILQVVLWSLLIHINQIKRRLQVHNWYWILWERSCFSSCLL